MLVFCWGFLHRCSSVKLGCSFVCVCVWYLCLVLVSERWWPYRMCLGVFPLLQILEHFQKDRCALFSKCLIEFACEAIWSWTFVCWKIFNQSFNFSTCDWSIHLFYLIWDSLGRLDFSKNLSLSSRFSILLAYSCM